jgi:hypothetical protein
MQLQIHPRFTLVPKDFTMLDEHCSKFKISSANLQLYFAVSPGDINLLSENPQDREVSATRRSYSCSTWH